MRMREDAHGASFYHNLLLIYLIQLNTNTSTYNTHTQVLSFYHNLLLIYLIQLNMQKRAAMRMREHARGASFRRMFVSQEAPTKLAAKPVCK